MSQTRETRLTLSGIVTQPSKYLTEPGSLKYGTNVMIRQAGVIEPRLAFESYKDPPPGGPGSDAKIPRAISCFDGLTLVSFGATASQNTILDSTCFVEPDGTSGFDFNESGASGFQTRGASAQMRDRVFIDSAPKPSSSAVKAQLVRAIDPDDYTTARRGGLIPPSWIDAQIGDPGEALLNTKAVAYRAHFERRHADGYIQIGPVSPVTLVDDSGGDVNIDLTIYWSRIATNNDWVRVGDYLRVYRTDNADTDAAVGDTMRLAVSVQLTSTNISNFFVTATDVSADAALGAFLYTNAGQGSSDESKWFPPSASDMVSFRNVMWYVTPFALRSFELRAPGGWGLFASGADGRDVGVGLFSITASGVVMANASFTANDPEGLSPGQVLTYSSIGGAGAWLVGAKIVSVVGAVVTMNSPAINGSFSDAIFGDVLEIDGVSYEAYSPARLVRSVAQTTGPVDEDEYPCWVFPSLPISFSDTQTQFETLYEGCSVQFVSPSYSKSFTSLLSTHAVRATNGARWSPPLPELAGTAAALGTDDPRRNRAHFSEIEEPEAVPVLNYRFFGAGTLLKLIAVEDAMLAFCTDGTYVCTGDGENWDVRPYDLALKLLHRNAVDVMDGAIWALTNRGVVLIDAGAKAQEVSTPFIGNRIRKLEEEFRQYFEPIQDPTIGAYNIMLRCDPYHKEVWVRYRDDDDEGVTLVFSLETKSWTEIDNETEQPTALAYDPAQNSMLLGQQRDEIGHVTGTGFTTLRKSFPDSSTSPSERMDSHQIEINPFAGGDLNTKKEWLQAVYDFEFLGVGALEIRPFFGNTPYAAAYEIAAEEGDQEHVVPVPRNAANSKQLSPGFTVTEAPEVVWKLSGLTVKFRVASPDTRRK